MWAGSGEGGPQRGARAGKHLPASMLSFSAKAERLFGLAIPKLRLRLPPGGEPCRTLASESGRNLRPPRPFFEVPIWHLKKVAEVERFYERRVAVRGVVGGCGAWLRVMVGCDENTFARERREMLTAHRIFIIAKSQTKARG